MASKLDLMLEAEKRGILPPEQAQLLNTARDRGLIDGGAQVDPQAQAEQAAPKPDSEKGFRERVGEDIEARKQKFQESEELQQAGEQTRVEAGFQEAGQIAAGVTDVIGQGIVSGFRALPDFIEDPIRRGFSEAGEFVLDTDVGRAGLEAAKAGAEKYGEFKDAHPRAARNLEAAVNITVLLAPVKGKPKVKPKPQSGMAGKVAGAIEESGKKGVAKRRSNFTQELVRPEQLKRQRVAQTGRTDVVGPLQKKVIRPNKVEADAAAEIALIPAVKPGNIIQKNLNVIQDTVRKEADDLLKTLKKNEIIFNRTELDNALKSRIAASANHPLLVGNAEGSAKRVYAIARKALSENKSSGSGVLKARRQFDREIERMRKNINEVDKLDGVTLAYSEARTAMNEFLISKAANVKVKESLRKQHNLLNAIEAMRPKAAAEAGDIIERLVDGVSSTTKIRTGSGAANKAIVGVELLGKQIRNGVLNPKGKIILGRLIKATDKAIKTSKDKAVVARLRADRAALLQLLDTNKEGQ